MPLPLTPLLMLLQASRPVNADASAEVMALLDLATFNDCEARILEILKETSPQEMGNLLRVLAGHTEEQIGFEGLQVRFREVSYLEKLYQDMNGSEFAAMCLIVKSKLLVLEAGGLDRFKAVLLKALNGERPAEIPVLKRYEPSEATSPSTWGARRYPANAEFSANGRLTTTWWVHTGFLDVHGAPDETVVMEPTDLMVLENAGSGQRDLAKVFDVKFLADEHGRNTLFTAVNVVGILLGAGLVSAAKGMAKKVLVAFVQVVFPTAGQYVSDHQEDILQLTHGPAFMRAWNAVNLLLAAFSVYQVFTQAGRSLWNALVQRTDDLAAANPGNEVAAGVKQQVERMDEGLRDIEAHVVASGEIPPRSGGSQGGGGPGGGSGGGGPGPPGGPTTPPKTTIIDRQPLDPDVSPVPITDGEIIATAKSELEIFFEWKRNAGVPGIKIFSDDDGRRFFLAKNATGDADKIKFPDGFSGARRILDMVDDFTGAEKCLVAAARQHLDTRIEVGIYSKVLPDGVLRYVVMEGIQDAVFPPAAGWTPVAHFHHEAAKARLFHYPAPKDFENALRKLGKAHVETIYSFDKNGGVVRVQFGMDADRGAFFVQMMNGERTYFIDPYCPDDLDDAVKVIQAGFADVDDQIRELNKLFEIHNVDPTEYYMAFWVAMFGQ